MMKAETVSETLNIDSILTWLIARENFILVLVLFLTFLLCLTIIMTLFIGSNTVLARI
jgi:hypothetical protein